MSMKAVSVKGAGVYLILRVTPPPVGQQEKAAPIRPPMVGVFLGSWIQLLSFWRWKRRNCFDCDRWGGNCHEPHTVWVWE
jgi:hypothetical protein